MSEPKKNLFGASRDELEQECLGKGLPAYRGKQLYRWLYRKTAGTFDGMTDLPSQLREELDRWYRIERPAVVARHPSRDGTVKYQLALEGGYAVETVAIPDSPRLARGPTRHTFCISTQVGCPLKCSFCFSGTVRFVRNLGVGEILGQFLEARARVEPVPERCNIVFMGMGEPLLNSENLLKALRILTDPEAFAVSPRRITVSTAGLAEELERFAAAAPRVGLAISLHATSNETRDRMMPINRKVPIERLLAAARRLPLPRRRRITFEYVLLGRENDSPEDARKLAELVRDIPVKVNLIAYNPWPGSPHRRSRPEAMSQFAEILAAEGLTVNLRRSRGDDVLAACGQLANQ